jgi:peroxiredoxin
LVSALRTFEQSASATYTQVEITPDGVVIRGDVSSASRTASVVQIGETNQGQLFTALESWIPGGQIDRFDWTWVEYPHNAVTPFGGVAKSAIETATFVLPKPPGVNQISRICLRVAGSRILPNGQSESVAVGTTCDVEEPVLTMDAPSWWGPLVIPVWKPDLAADAILGDAVSAHISVQSDHPQRRLSRNVLVFFPDWQNDAPLETLSKALGAARRQQIAPDLLVVVPAGAFALTRREFEARLTPLSTRQIARIQVAEDTEGGWARSFGVDQTPSLFLVNSRRQFVWQAGGRLDPAEIATALDTHHMPAGVQRFRPVRGRADVGEPAPDFYFKDDGGNEGALHRLLGRPVLITFWQPWSAPSLAELRRLQTLHNLDRGGGPFILAFCGGAEDKGFADIRKELGLTFALVHDAEHRVARAFGIRVWPTTITINAAGRIEHIGLGGEADYPKNLAR